MSTWLPELQLPFYRTSLLAILQLLWCLALWSLTRLRSATTDLASAGDAGVSVMPSPCSSLTCLAAGRHVSGPQVNLYSLIGGSDQTRTAATSCTESWSSRTGGKAVGRTLGFYSEIWCELGIPHFLLSTMMNFIISLITLKRTKEQSLSIGYKLRILTQNFYLLFKIMIWEGLISVNYGSNDLNPPVLVRKS